MRNSLTIISAETKGYEDRMGENPALSVVIADKIIAFLTDNIWPVVLVIFIIILRNALSQLLKRIISFDFSFGSAKGSCLKFRKQDT